jgi:hypothetical protein
MRRTILVLAVAATAVTVTAVGGAQTPTETPFPAPKVVQYFLSTQTVTSTGALSNYFPQGSTVVFRAFAGQSKTGNVLTGDAVKYFYVQIPGQPNIKLTYSAPPAKKGLPAPWPWTATWTVPATFTPGLVQFKVLLRTKAGQYGSFVQIPVATSQLTVTKAA